MIPSSRGFPRVGLVLSGCGFLDGAEVHEATLTLLHLDRAGASTRALAPDVDQVDSIDHVTRKPVQELRSVLSESARLVRGKIAALGSVKAEELDALVLPGGYGVVKNLCTYAKRGVDCEVHAPLARLVFEMHAANKPLGFWCIAPIVAARVLGRHRIKVTVGNDPETAQAIEKMGAQHVNCTVDGIVVDEVHKIVSTPAYMLGSSIARVEPGIAAAVQKVLELCR